MDEHKELLKSLDQLIMTAERLKRNLQTQRDELREIAHSNCECDVCLLEQGGFNALAMAARENVK